MQFWIMQLEMIMLLPRMNSALGRLEMDPLGSRLVDNEGRWVFVGEQMRIGSCRVVQWWCCDKQFGTAAEIG